MMWPGLWRGMLPTRQDVERKHQQLMAELLQGPSPHSKNHWKNARARLAKAPAIAARHRRQKKNAKRKN